ncbi:MAG: recombination regulator RecX [Candidatus Nanopelagicales bacterium]|jgi:regulatory protein|nr:recombination regulator RecX [Candidatus Nanopelagicales bacterium]MDP4746325.1 recombination regulator RecX [Candidatus Nanopelagicales bacterium]
MGEVVQLDQDGAASKRRRTKSELKLNLIDATITQLPVMEEKNKEIEAADAAKQVLLRRLSHAPRTRKELAKDLKDKDISDEVANVALDRFEEVGLINDQALASNYVSSQHERKGLGKNALRQQLRAKGVSDDVALEAISQISDDQEFQAAFALACKKIRSLQRDDAKTQLRKIVGVLARKGYSSNLAFSVAKEVIKDLPDGLPAEI